jgi:DUF3093 family protein
MRRGRELVDYVYEERLPKAWSVTCLTAFAAGVVWTGTQTLPDGIGAFLALTCAYLFVLVPLLGVPISKRRYHRIQLTTEVLRVGRERLPVADLDPASIGAPYEPAGSEPRLVGGAYGPPLGWSSVVVRTRRGEPLVICTRDPDALLAALAQVTGARTV